MLWGFSLFAFFLPHSNTSPSFSNLVFYNSLLITFPVVHQNVLLYFQFLSESMPWYEWRAAVCLSVFSTMTAHSHQNMTLLVSLTQTLRVAHYSLVTHPGQCSKFCHLIVCDASQTESRSVILFCKRMKVITFCCCTVTDPTFSSLASVSPVYVWSTFTARLC